MSEPLGFPQSLAVLRAEMPGWVRILEEGREDAWYGFATLHDSQNKRAVVSRSETLEVRSDRGVVLRIVAGGQNFEAASNDLQSDALTALARALRRQVEAADLDPDAPVYHPPSWADEDLETLHPLFREQLPDGLGPAAPVHFGVPVGMPPQHTTVQHLAAASRVSRQALLDEAEKQGRVLANASALYMQRVDTTVFVDRHRNLSQSLVVTAGRVMGYLPTGAFYGDQVGGMGGVERAEVPVERIARVVKVLGELAGAERLTPGVYPIITSPVMTGIVAHEAFGHSQEGDTRMLGRSCATALHASGEPVGAAGATIMSNPAVFETHSASCGSNGSFFFDDEGQLARPHAILEEGVVQTPMNHLLSALLGDGNGPAPRRANGRRESWRRPLMARQSNTYFTGGDKTLEELIGMVKHGFLAEDAAGGMEDPKGMRLTAGAQYLREIVDGKLSGRVFVGPQGGQVELNGLVPDILRGLVAKTAATAGKPPTIHLGGCLKYHKEYVPAGTGGPYILWAGMQCG